MEVGRGELIPLPAGEDVVPDSGEVLAGIATGTAGGGGTVGVGVSVGGAKGTATADVQDGSEVDNRDLMDDNTAQIMDQDSIAALRESGLAGRDIVAKLVGSSSTFEAKTDFSKAKYIARKQMKYQPRCRVVRCTGYAVCEAMFLKVR